MFQIPSKCQKNNKNRLLPMAPERAEFLRAVEDRSGYVFDPKSRRPSSGRLGEQAVGRTVCQIGERAGIKVNENKFASAHDLWRSFGTRWSRRVKPQVLQKMMRHKRIETTLRYYVMEEAERALPQRFGGLSTT